MRKFNPVKLIRTFQIWIIILALLTGGVFYVFLEKRQTYTASALIEYSNAEAAEGKAPDGSKIDTSEIYAADVMKEVFDRMGLEYSQYNLDKVRSRIRVQTVFSEEEKAVQEAQNEQGEESETKPTKYMVSFTATHEDSDAPEVFAGQVIDNMLDVFLKKYGENHIVGGSVVNDISGLDEGHYDYLETVELIEQSVENTITKLSSRIQSETIYRSSETGYSFNDLYREFSLIGENDIPNLFAYILNNRVTKDRDVLISKYQNRIENYHINNEASQEEIARIKEIIDSYIRMMRESGNTSITYEYILDEIHDNYYKDEEADQWLKPDETVEYDVLLENYLKDRNSYENALIDIAYCEYILGIYSQGVPDSDLFVDAEAETANEALNNGGTVLDVNTNISPNEALTNASLYPGEAEMKPAVVDAEKAVSTIEQMIGDLLDKLDSLYGIYAKTTEEYNEYAGAGNIGLISSIVINPNLQVALYTGLFVVVMMVFLSLAVLVLGRLWDIFDYYVYTDAKLFLPNRAACDRYLKRHGKTLLKTDMVCVSIRLLDVSEKNRIYGRSACDEMMKEFASCLKRAFPQTEDCFMAVNGLGQFIIFLENMKQPQGMVYLDYLRELTENYNSRAECKMEFCYGVADAETDSVFEIKRLMLCAIERTQKSTAGQIDPPQNEDISGTDKKVDMQMKSEQSEEPQETVSKESENRAAYLIKKLEEIKERN